MTEPTTITLKFSIEQVNALLQLLGDLPFAKSEPAITAIRNQALPQVPQEAPEEAPAT